MSLSTDSILSSAKISDSIDQSKVANIDLTTATTSTQTTLGFNQTSSRSIAFPDNSGTVALTSDVPTIQTGSQSVTHDSDTDGSTKRTTIAFGSTFTTVPKVFPLLKNLSDPNQIYSTIPSNVTTSSFDTDVLLKDFIPKETTVVDNDGAVGLQLCMEIVDNNPAIAYWENSPGTQIKFARSSTSIGVDNSPWIRTIITTDNVGFPSLINRNLSMAIINGNPAIAFYDFAAGEIKYIRANDAQGTSWGATVTVTSLPRNYDGTNPYLLEVNGNPAIAYTYAESPFLNRIEYYVRYVRATNSTGSTWSAPVNVYTDNITYGVKRDTFMAIVNGRPAIVFSMDSRSGTVTFTQIWYSRANDVDGTSWPGSAVRINIDPGRYPYLAVINGLPTIAAYRATSFPGLRYAQASDVNGTSWPNSNIVIINDTIVGGPSLMEMNGFPVIAYAYNGLNITRASTPSGLEGTWTSRVVDNSTFVSRTPIIRIVEDQVGIGYYDQSNTQAKFALGTLNSYEYDISYMAVE